MMTKPYIIEMKQFYRTGSRALAGRDYGHLCRNKIGLSKLENSNCKIIIVFDEELFSLNTSFFKGFFGESVKTYGKEKFNEKYTFQGAEDITSDVINSAIDDILKVNSLLN